MFDRATLVARGLFADSQSIIILVKDGKAWRSRYDSGAMPQRDPAAEQVIATGELLWIEDAHVHPLVCDSAVVKGPPYLRAYIGAPIRMENGATRGVLVVVNRRPLPYDASKAAQLAALAAFVADEWERAEIAYAHSESNAALAASRTTQAALFSAVPISLVLTDTQMRVVAASRVWETHLGQRDKPYVGRTIFEIAPQVYEPWASLYDECLKFGHRHSGRRVPVGKVGERTMWMQTEIKPWRNSDGEIGGLIITGDDVSELVEGLERAERSEQRLNVALQVADVHVWELDHRRRELIKSEDIDNLFDRQVTYEDLAQDIMCNIDPRDRPAVRQAWRRHVEEGEPYRPQYRINRADGVEIWVEASSRQLRGGDGKTLRVVGALQDITRRRESEHALRQARDEAEAANKAKSVFLATMSHEIRTPLNGVLGMAQAMAAEELSPAQRERLDVVRQSGESLLAILNDVLDLSKIEAGKLELEETEFDIEALARGAYAAFTAIAAAKDLTFELTVEPAARGVWRGDATRVRQLLYNLVSNAIKFTEVGEVEVRVSRAPKAKGAGLVLRVRDTGIGIAAEPLSRLFTKFEQGDATTTRRYGGTGLGLAICRELAELMGGEILAESEPDRGSTFTALLPLRRISRAAPPPEPAAETPPAAVLSGPLKVLAAEDNAVNQLVLKTLLLQLGLTPVVVGNGADAVAAWEAEPWDLILMDVQMPVMDGPTATRAIRAGEARAGRARTPIVALTANAMSHQVSEYLAAGMDDFVAKPIEAARLFEAISRAADGEGPAEDAAANA
ncbi:ATP-binding protein [Phenylobacterium sp.]|uniref:ATP-binding protein n=1 Tax=Phenylobacterium sp. TaxID=1871053 RepID=UPI0025CD01A3|nr:ATP-binding protein [Phenylobacterium sp.]